ncbi:MAG: glycoside hydrolase family 3 protein [Verrucomicrobiae bacterium]|nr:glycoside hydrolase family 3 protein [Verrucomicrobiae bacterium]
MRSLHGEVGRRLFVGIPGAELDDATARLLEGIRPGGIILFGRNVVSAAQTARLTRDLRRRLGPRLCICLDHEGGRVNRLAKLTGAVPSAPQLAYLGAESLARRQGQLAGRLLRELGVNANLAPVLDLWLQPGVDNSVPDRCWSRDPDEVTRLAGAFLRAMQAEGVLGCGKHFLGYGAADKDPHKVLPRVNRSRAALLRDDLRPYAKLWANGRGPLRMIMLSHAHLRAFHGATLTPACVSSKLVGDLLRRRLGFRGVTITDDLEMGAISRTLPIGEAATRGLQLGVDFLLICHTPDAIRAAFEASIKAVADRKVAPSVMREAGARLDRLTARLPSARAFSSRRFDALVRESRAFTACVFARLPERLRKTDARWGPIGEA